MVDTERMKRVLNRLPPIPPLPPFSVPEEPPGIRFAEALFRREAELEGLCREIGRRSRSLSGSMDRLRAASRRRQAALRRIFDPERFPPPPPGPGRGREGIWRLLQRSSSVAGELAQDYALAAREGQLPPWLARSAEESSRSLQRQMKRMER